MANLSGRVINERFSPSRKITNSFYEIMSDVSNPGKEYFTQLPEVVYYIDKRTDRLSAKETSLLW